MWLLASILSLLPAFAEPGAGEEEPEFPRVGVVPAANLWVRDGELSGHWEYREEKLYLLEWTRDEWGEWHYSATECTPDEARQAEEYGEMYGGG